MSNLAGFSLLVVDDHPLFRDGLRLALLQQEPLLTVQAVATLAEALALLRQDMAIDLVLLDYRLPGEDGLRCAQQLRRQYPQVACAIMSGADDARLPARVREAGLMGYFPKSLDVAELLVGLRDLAQGRSHFVPLQSLPMAAPTDSLTPRQREVLDMVARGATNKEIAQILQIAPHTVKNHLEQIFQRLGAANRAQAVSMARESTYGEPP